MRTMTYNLKHAHSKALESGCLLHFNALPFDYDTVSWWEGMKGRGDQIAFCPPPPSPIDRGKGLKLGKSQICLFSLQCPYNYGLISKTVHGGLENMHLSIEWLNDPMTAFIKLWRYSYSTLSSIFFHSFSASRKP